jgi:hypothetical protein
LANTREFIPPPSIDPVPLSPKETGSFILVFTQKKWPIEIKNMEEAIIVEDVDR